MFISKRRIDPEPQMIATRMAISIKNGNLTIAQLREIGLKDDDEFGVYEDEDCVIGGYLLVYYTDDRLETEQEVAKRVAEDEAYNKRYDEYYANHHRR